MASKKFICSAVFTALFVWTINPCFGQDVSQILQNLTPEQQNQLISQISNQISTGTTTTTGTSTGTDNGTGGFPHGRTALNYVRQYSPGASVEAARSGNPQFLGETFTMPVDEPDFWDRVKTVFIDALYQAITTTFGSYITIPTVTIPTAGQ